MGDPLELNCRAFLAMVHGDRATAEALFRECLSIDPENPDALRYLGEMVGQDGRSVEAVPLLRNALAKNPSLWATWCDLGQALQTTAQTEDEMVEGLAHTMTGTKIAERERGQVFAAGRYNQALGLISLGDWKRGWADCEWGYPCGKRPLRTLKGKLWKGEEIKPDETLFVYWEGGYGDTIFWMRYLPLLRQRVKGKIILEVQRALKPLIAGSTGAHCAVDSITVPNIDDLQEVPEFDYRISLGSLAYRLGLETPGDPQAPYLRPNVAPWPIRGPQFKVGIVWKGNPALDNDKNRSTTEQVMMRDLYDLGGVHYYSLQYDTNPEYAIPMPIKSYLDTAAMIKAMDLLITVDTSVAHVAGAMGKECWLLIPYTAPDFRWGIGNERTPLYPSWRLYRQKTPGDYEECMMRVRDDLETMIKATVTPGAREAVLV